MGFRGEKTGSYVLIAVNTITILVGILVCVAGVMGILNQGKINEYSGGYDLELVCYGVLITGVIIIIVGAFGWFAGFNGSILVGKVYVILIIIIAVLQLVFFVVEFLKKDEITSEIEGYMNKTMNGTAYDDMTPAEQDIINVIQTQLECCGLENGDDTWGSTLPASCCESSDNSTSTADCTTDNAFSDGCRDAATGFASNAIQFSVFILIAGFVLEFICVFAALFSVREGQRRKYAQISG